MATNHATSTYRFLKWHNLFQSLLLVIALLLLLAIIGWLVAGLTGIIWASLMACILVATNSDCIYTPAQKNMLSCHYPGLHQTPAMSRRCTMMKKTRTLFTAFSRTTPIIALLLAGLTLSPVVLAEKERTAASLIKQTLLNTYRPEFTLPDINNKKRSVKEWTGKILVVNFWATWCTPCRKEIPVFNKLHKEYAKQDVRFIGIAIDNLKAVNQFMQTIPIEYPVLIGGVPAIKHAVSFGNTSGTLPYTAIVGKDGKIKTMLSGKLTEKQARKSIEKLL